MFQCRLSRPGTSGRISGVVLLLIFITSANTPAQADTAELHFSHRHGFYDQSFNLQISSDPGDAIIRYTLDGSDPLASAGAVSSQEPVTIAINPSSSEDRPLTPSVTVRAVAINGDSSVSEVKTQTYIFPDAVLTQTYPGGSWPDTHTNGQIIEYDMADDVVNDPRYSGELRSALLDIPTISLVTDLRHLFGPDSGIYVNAWGHGRVWERPVSVELIYPDGKPGFQVNAGLRIRGGWSRHNDCPKHAFRLFFRSEYGPGELEYPMFGDEGVREFDKLDLRTSQNYSWSYKGSPYNTMTRDVFSRDVQGQMGQPYTRSRYYHLYLNGMYWGLFQSQERAEARFAESYFGAEDSLHDVIKVDIGEDWNLYDIEATDGNLNRWEEVWDYCQRGFADNADYYALQGLGPDGDPDPSLPVLVDIDNLIDYMLIIFYTGNFDAPVSKFSGNRNPNNFYAIINREGESGFRFYVHDAEHTLLIDRVGPGSGLEENRVEIDMIMSGFNKFHPQWLHRKLTTNPKYRLRFADHVYKHMFHGGALTPESTIPLFQKRADEIDLAIIAESARWGDAKRSTSRTKDDDWLPAIHDIINNYLPARHGIVLDQLRSAGLYPTISPPVFNLPNGAVSIGTALEMSSEDGTIFYTTNGNDPAEEGGREYTGPVVISEATTVKARTLSDGTWSALAELELVIPAELQITEIHYHPLDSLDINDTELEFIELKNLGSELLDLSAYTFSDGIDYTLPDETLLAPEDFLLLASDSTHFSNRYGFPADGEYRQQLSNGGESVLLIDNAQDTVIYIEYDDEYPWPNSADGDGYSLVLKDPESTGNPNDPALWRASSKMHGSPGADDQSTTVISGPTPLLPITLVLHQNYPNPFNATTTIRFTLETSVRISLDLFNLQGQQIATLTQGTYEAGTHIIHWNAEGIPSGIYFYRLATPKEYVTKRMILLR